MPWKKPLTTGRGNYQTRSNYSYVQILLVHICLWIQDQWNLENNCHGKMYSIIFTIKFNSFSSTHAQCSNRNRHLGTVDLAVEAMRTYDEHQRAWRMDVGARRWDIFAQTNVFYCILSCIVDSSMFFNWPPHPLSARKCLGALWPFLVMQYSEAHSWWHLPTTMGSRESPNEKNSEDPVTYMIYIFKNWHYIMSTIAYLKSNFYMDYH